MTRPRVRSFGQQAQLWPVVAVLASVSLVAFPHVLAGQIQIFGQVDVVAKVGYERPLSRNFRGDDPLNELRFRLYTQHWLSERIAVFGELLYDINAQARVNGAYLVVNELAGRSWLNMRVGLSPSVVGTFGTRSTYFNVNPLLGAPLVWHYRTALDPGARASPSELVQRKESGARGLPLLYESCWNVQWDLSGAAGAFEYAVGVTPGAVSNPISARSIKGAQLMARLGATPTTGLRFGLSAAHGPYIGEFSPPTDITAEFTERPQDFDQTLAGYDVAYARGPVQLFSEGYWSSWETPEITERLEARGGYVEGRYDVAPGWYVAVRTEAITFSDVAVTAGGAITREAWDNDVWRLESAVGYRYSREVLIKVGWQHYGFAGPTAEDMDVLALQVSATF